MYAIDEFNRIGYFVSDRRQPEGKVCIYVFIPSERRKTYDPSEYSEQQIRDFADIISIADTWGNGSERKAAIDRWRSIGRTVKNNSEVQTTFQSFVVNDALTYSSASDFRSPEAARLYKQLIADRQQFEKLNNQLDNARTDYAKANASNRQSLRRDILNAEQEVELLNASIKQLEKQIRQAELKFIN